MSGARDYAAALFSLSEELRTSDEVLTDLTVCRDVFKKNPAYVSLTDTPAVSVPEKIALIDTAFEKVNESVRNLIKILCEKHSVHIFSEVTKEFITLYNESRGICPAEIVSAVALTEDQKSKIKQKMESMTGKKVTIKNIVDKDILGGIKLRFMGRQYDASLSNRLNSIEKSLKETVI